MASSRADSNPGGPVFATTPLEHGIARARWLDGGAASLAALCEAYWYRFTPSSAGRWGPAERMV